MKKILLLLSILAINKSYSQHINALAGTTLSKLDWKIGNTKRTTKNLNGLYVAIGIEVPKNKLFNLSLALGYVEKGGSDELQLTSGSGAVINTVNKTIN